MSREKRVFEKERLNVWVLPNQIRDIEKISQVTGKKKTDVVIEALGIYSNLMRKEGVL